MRARTKRVQRGDGSTRRVKGKTGLWGMEGSGVRRGREGRRDWSIHERWVV